MRLGLASLSLTPQQQNFQFIVCTEKFKKKTTTEDRREFKRTQEDHAHHCEKNIIVVRASLL